METSRNLSPDAPAADEPKYWAVFSDVALALLLVFVLFIMAQFLHYEKIAIIERIAVRQREVADLIASSLPDSLAGSVAVRQEDDYHQRITFQSELLFESCRTNMDPGAADLIRTIAAVVGTRSAYFEAIGVEGHTDRRPARPGPGSSCVVDDNWELASGRATEVLRAMAGPELVAPALLRAIGRAEFNPVAGAEGDTPGDYARNRRIELVLRYTDVGVMDE